MLLSSVMGSFGVVMLVVISARKAVYMTEDRQINLKQWVAPLVASCDVAAFKDPHLNAPDDFVLRMARLALACTAMSTASRPSMARVLGDLLAMKDEIMGAEVHRAACRIDREIDSSADLVDFDVEMARVEHMYVQGGYSISQPFASRRPLFANAEEFDDERYAYDEDDDAGDDDDIPAGDDGDVVALTAATFSQAVSDHKHVMVEFYAPWCGHCRALAPEYREAAATLKELGVLFAKVDATKETELADKYNVDGYPTVLFATDGEFQPFGAGRTSAEIVRWVKRKLGMGVSALAPADIPKVPALLVSAAAAAVAFVSSLDSPEAAAFGEAARDTDGVDFFITTHADVAAAFGLPAGEPPVLAVVKKEEERLVVFDGEYTKEAISSFLAANRLPLLLTYTEEISAAIFSSPIGKQVLLFASDSAVKELSPALFSAAKQFKGQAMFVLVNASDPESQPVQEYFGADASTTAIMGFTMGGGEDPSVPAAGLKYRMTDHPTADNIKSFTHDFIDGRLKPFFKSQPIPGENEGPVTVVVGDSFESIVLDDSKDVLLEVYAPWCGHCQQLEPTYKRLAERFSAVQSVVIAKMDGTANEYPGLEVEGFPTVVFYPAGKKTDPVKVAARTLKEFIQAINDHASTEFHLEPSPLDEEEEESGDGEMDEEMEGGIGEGGMEGEMGEEGMEAAEEEEMAYDGMDGDGEEDDVFHDDEL
ncbi:unnamed protein product [Closterium sp. Yama58-4]|nr:unnamed protein product [Closterium sp. Yama58-4]